MRRQRLVTQDTAAHLRQRPSDMWRSDESTGTVSFSSCGAPHNCAPRHGQNTSNRLWLERPTSCAPHRATSLFPNSVQWGLPFIFPQSGGKRTLGPLHKGSAGSSLRPSGFAVSLLDPPPMERTWDRPA